MDNYFAPSTVLMISIGMKFDDDDDEVQVTNGSNG